MFQILVVEDNENLLKLMRTRLEQAGYRALPAHNGEEALDVMDKQHVDLIVSDIMMPHMDGFEFIESLRAAHYNMPILIVTAKEGFADKERGFRLGSDDYMVKPIDMNEMVLRIAALLRRAKIANEHKIVIGSMVLDYDQLRVKGPGIDLVLPKKEFLLLFKLLSYPRRIFTREQLIIEIWGPDTDVDERTVDSHIKKLRKKLADRPEFKIVTIRGLGYKAEKFYD